MPPLTRRYFADACVAADEYWRCGAVEALEAQFARLLGTEAAVFIPTGTLANHLAVRILSGARPGPRSPPRRGPALRHRPRLPLEVPQRRGWRGPRRREGIVLPRPQEGSFWPRVNETLAGASAAELAAAFHRAAEDAGTVRDSSPSTPAS